MMLTDSERRAVSMAVSRHAEDKVHAQKALQAALATLGKGTLSDLLNQLVRQNIIKDHQLDEFRRSLHQNDRANLAPTLISMNQPSVQVEELETPFDEFGEYRILRKIGQGGMCPVFLAYSENKRRNVALKILPAEMAMKQFVVDRFYREAKSGSLLNHANIVRNLAFGQDLATQKHYLVMEYVDGPTALELLEKFHHLDVGDAVSLILDIARGLEHAHSRNIIHRDVKPDNVLITSTGIAKLADLGLAKRTDESSHLTAARQGFGTPYYMPYEQAINAKAADGRCDIYALGATLYHLVTGEVPFPGESHIDILEKKEYGWFAPASSVNPEIPPELNDILEKSLAREPKDRFQTVSEFIVALERTKLARTVPSFVDEQRAMSDPLVRERLAGVPQPTSRDLRLPARMNQKPAQPAPDTWYLRYRNGADQWCKTKATTSQVIQRFRDKKIPKDVEAAQKPDGEFQPLLRYPQFRRLLRQQTITNSNGTHDSSPVRETKQPFWSQLFEKISSRWVLFAGGSLVLAILAATILVTFLSGN